MAVTLSIFGAVSMGDRNIQAHSASSGFDFFLGSKVREWIVACHQDL